MGVSISEFRGEYYFLSNFYSAPVIYNGMCFENNEAAFQAAKCPERMTEFCRLNPSEAKRLGRRVKLRGDWEAVKDTVMYEICTRHSAPTRNPARAAARRAWCRGQSEPSPCGR